MKDRIEYAMIPIYSRVVLEQVVGPGDLSKPSTFKYAEATIVELVERRPDPAAA